MDQIIFKNTNKLNLIFKYNLNDKKIYIYFLKLNNYIVYYCLGSDVVLLNKNRLFFKTKSTFNLFKNTLYKRFYEMVNGYFLEMNLIGIGYSMFILNKYLYIDLGFSHYIGIKIPNNLILKRFKYRLIVFSFSKILVKNFSKKLNMLKKVDIYKGKGFLYNDVKLKLKEGKKR